MKRITYTHEESSTVEVFEVRGDGSVLWTMHKGKRALLPMAIPEHYMRARFHYLEQRGYTRTES